MKKRFATFMLMGKACAMPFCGSSALAEVDLTPTNMLSSELHLLEKPVTGEVRLLSELAEAPSGSAYGGTAAEITFPGTSCTTQAPTEMTVVVTGLSDGDNVYLFSSREKDNHSLSATYPDFRVGSDMTQVAVFQYKTTETVSNGGDVSSAVGMVSLPIDLTTLQVETGDTIYLQAITLKNTPGSGDFDFSTIRFSELDKITALTEDCSTYGESSY